MAWINFPPWRSPEGSPAIKNNFNDTIGSDHAPHLKVNKDKVSPNTPSGMPGVQTLLPIMLDHINNNKLSINQLVNFVCKNPVKIQKP